MYRSGPASKIFFPSNHQNTLLYRQYRRYYGGAQTLAVMLRVKNGDIFNYSTLQKIEDITRAVNILPEVDHNEVFSLASYRVAFAKAVPGAVISTCYMYPRIPQNQQELSELRHNVMVHREPVAGLVAYDNKGALITASFNERAIDYKQLFDQAGITLAAVIPPWATRRRSNTTRSSRPGGADHEERAALRTAGPPQGAEHGAAVADPKPISFSASASKRVKAEAQKLVSDQCQEDTFSNAKPTN